MLEALETSPAARAIGLALIQFIWQGAAIGVVTAVVLIALRRASAQSRYLVACAGLALMVAAPVMTMVRLLPEAPAGPAVVRVDSVAAMADVAIVGATDLSNARPGPSWRERLEPQLPLVVVAWSTGVLLLALQLGRGWLRIARIRRRASWLTPAEWPAGMRDLAERLGVTRRLRLAASALTDVPAVIGWLRPVIVVPASALAGLPPAQLEAILAHELAHVRRADYLVNVAQCLVEILLFYHPAVWWVSRQIRLEREHCCDDVAASWCADRIAYAGALASLEELRGVRPGLAVTATGGDLLQRVRRLVEPGSASGPQLSGGVVMGVAMTVVLLAVSGQMQGAPVPQTQPVPAVEAVTVVRATPVTSRQAPATVTVTVASAAPTQAMTPVHVVSVAEATTLVPAQAVTTTVASAAAAPATTQATSLTAVAPVARTQVVTAPAQATRGAIAGRVVDADGGVIPGAEVLVSWPNLSNVFKTITNSRGEFVVGDLDTGTFEVTVTQQGFKTSRIRLHVPTGVTVTPTIRLDLGGLTEVIEVSSSAPAQSPAQSGRTAAPPKAADYLATARMFYEQGRLADAERMTSRALELLRAEMPVNVTLAPPQPTGVVRVGGEVEFPRKLVSVEPFYPQFAKVARIQGMVYIDAVLAKDGGVKDAVVMSGPEPLREAALAAVRQWRYTPTKLNGVPVEVIMTVFVNFRVR